MIHTRGINIQFDFDGKLIRADVDSYSRGGTRSPYLNILVYQGKRYTPYQQRKLGIYWTVLGLLTFSYTVETLEHLVYKENPFLALVPNNEFAGKYPPVPFTWDKS